MSARPAATWRKEKIVRLTTGGLARVLGGTALCALCVVSFAAFGASSFAQASPVTKSATTAASTTPAQNPITALESIGPASATGKTVSLAKGAQGIFLIGPNGHTLYIFTEDHGTTSACKSGECAKLWHALTATGALRAGPGINAKEVKTALGQVKHQVTYYGHLLYYFKGDASPGQTNGANVTDWNLLGPFGNVMLPHA
jgi:predicted lipoprotein with Yx(FWY)xxD motif